MFNCKTFFKNQRTGGEAEPLIPRLRALASLAGARRGSTASEEEVGLDSVTLSLRRWQVFLAAFGKEDLEGESSGWAEEGGLRSGWKGETDALRRTLDLDFGR